MAFSVMPGRISFKICSSAPSAIRWAAIMVSISSASLLPRSSVIRAEAGVSAALSFFV